MTNGTKHTEGPWQVRPKQPLSDGFIDYEVWAEKTHALICVPTGGAYRELSERESNARLIAAAPELLAACKALVSVLATHADCSPAPLDCVGRDRHLAALDAIAKAEGAPLASVEDGFKR